MAHKKLDKQEASCTPSQGFNFNLLTNPQLSKRLPSRDTPRYAAKRGVVLKEPHLNLFII